jgi:carbamoyltransferase
MIIVGISGFEDIRGASARSTWEYRPGPANNMLDFADNYLPLQYFPLHLIGHDCSAALLIDGELVAFAAEERFSRIKHGLNLAGKTVLPRSAVQYCLSQAGVTWRDIDYIAHFCDFNMPAVHHRFSMLSDELKGDQLQILKDQSLDIYENCLSREVLHKQLTRIAGVAIDRSRLIPVRHHLAHAAGAFYSSGFDDALILTVDGFGEEESSLAARGTGSSIDIIDRTDLPTSLGMLYQVITAFLGFRSYGDEYKVMGLSSYGDRNRYRGVFRELVELRSNGRYAMSQITSPGLSRTLKDCFGTVAWHNGFSKKAADIAAGLQDTLEITLLHVLSHYRKLCDLNNLCLSGGVALNATANGVIKRSGLFDRVYIQPAAGDDGACLGAALYVDRQLSGRTNRKPITHMYWGPEYSYDQIEDALRACNEIKWQSRRDIVTTTARLLSEGWLIGWFQGRMEMGPRALGARSILSDPRKRAYRDRINAKIKKRESFRPFAPAALEDEARNFFYLDGSDPDPYMITTVPVNEEKRHLIPAVTHVDGTSRLQAVTEKSNKRFFQLLREFQRITGIPMVLNTSFNRAGEPIVCTPGDALNCFLECGLDALVIGDFLVTPRRPTGERSE